MPDQFDNTPAFESPEADPLQDYGIEAALKKLTSQNNRNALASHVQNYIRDRRFVEPTFHLKPEFGSEAYAFQVRLDDGRINNLEVADKLLYLCTRQYVIQTLLRLTRLPRGLSYLLEDDPRVQLAIQELEDDARETVHSRLTRRQIRDTLRRNRRYAKELQAAERQARDQKEKTFRLKLISDSIKNDIPNDPALLYPEARKMKRHFILHLGDTNSGKSHQSVEAMAKAPTGMYLAPLRLLAYEIYGRLNSKGVPCSMMTGEERIETADSHHTARTMELCDLTEKYDVVVIDEAQMIEDRERGGAWTEAILGVQSPEIHICAAPYAREILIKIITSCNDTYEVVEHTRMTPLVPDSNLVDFPNGIEEGDALIVFSRRDVIAMGAELQINKIPCSVIYGALPYDVRQSEVDKLISGQTKVVVATDAIGMGMNLPIRRVVFCATRKFDGISRRELNATEVQQIAGRAGRFGLNEKGYYAAAGGFSLIKDRMNTRIPQIRRAMLGFPSRLTDNGGRLSETLEVWAKASARSGLYEKSTITRVLPMCQWLEERIPIKDRVNPEKKLLILSLIRIPFNERAGELISIWRDLSAQVVAGKEIDARDILSHKPYLSKNASLEKLEQGYAVCDLLFHFARTYVSRDCENELMEEKRAISESINALLAKQRLRRKQCNMCGKPMSWDNPGRVCDRCKKMYYWS